MKYLDISNTSERMIKFGLSQREITFMVSMSMHLKVIPLKILKWYMICLKIYFIMNTQKNQ